MTVNQWIPNPGTGNPVREGETLTELRFSISHGCTPKDNADAYDWSHKGPSIITHYQVSPTRTAAPTAEPATLSADEVLIRAREAAIAAWNLDGEGDLIGEGNKETVRNGSDDDATPIRAILAYERDRAKPLAEVAPHTVEDVDKTEAERIAVEYGWKIGHSIRDVIRAGIKRGRELERGA